jgi:serine/threonine protein kinase
VAVKEFRTDHISFNWPEFRREMAIGSILDNENIVGCIGGSIVAPKLFIVSEFMSKGSLRDLMENNRKHNIIVDRKLAIKFSWDIAKGMAYLHSHGIMHRFEEAIENTNQI